jgi:REP element-mobilizing transposase RayT
LAPEQLQLTVSAIPQVSPQVLASRIKGRLQYHCRRRGNPVDFSRKLAVRSIGNPTRAEVEAYIRSQLTREALVDARFHDMLASLAVINRDVDLSLPTETKSGRYWYNLHLVLVASERYRSGDPATLTRLRETILKVCTKKGYLLSTAAVMPDHIHMALRGTVQHSPEAVALSFLNNLAFALGQRKWWQDGYYAGTFSEYGMAAVRSSEG